MRTIRLNAAVFAVVLIVAGVAVVALHGLSGKSIAWVVGLLLLLLAIENLPTSSRQWRTARLAAFAGVLVGWFVVVYSLG